MITHSPQYRLDCAMNLAWAIYMRHIGNRGNTTIRYAAIRRHNRLMEIDTAAQEIKKIRKEYQRGIITSEEFTIMVQGVLANSVITPFSLFEIAHIFLLVG